MKCSALGAVPLPHSTRSAPRAQLSPADGLLYPLEAVSRDEPHSPQRRSIRTRWIASLVAVALVPLGGLTALSLRAQRAGLALAEKELEVAVLDRVADLLLRDLDFASEATVRAGRLLAEPSIADPEARLTLAREVMARAAALAHLAVYDAQGRQVDTIARAGESAQPAAPEQLPEALVAAPPAGGQWLPVDFGPYGVALRFAQPLARDGAVRGWVVGTLSPRWVDTTLAGLSRDRFGHDDRVLVVDPQLRLLTRGPGTGVAVGASLAGRDVFARTHLPPAAFTRRVELSLEFVADGTPMVGTLRTLPEHRWAMVVRRPEREAFGALHRARKTLLAAGLAAVLLAAALGLWAGLRAVRPIEALNGLVQAYAARRFEARVALRTGDELQTLAESLASMADQIVAGEAEVARRQRVEADLGRFLPAEVARAVASGERALSLGGSRRTVTALFADVVAFTGFAESAPPERVVAFLNELFGVLTEVIFRHEGMVDKFLGDCVMAVFGASEGMAPGDQCARALACAEDMHRFVEASAPQWRDAYGLEVQLGIGVNVGEVLVGNLGSEARMEFTAIGDAVNVAARLEALARGGQTLVTRAVTAAAPAGQFLFHPLGAHPLRGKRDAVEIFEVIA